MITTLIIILTICIILLLNERYNINQQLILERNNSEYLKEKINALQELKKMEREEYSKESERLVNIIADLKEKLEKR